jgi:hypothetical protein
MDYLDHGDFWIDQLAKRLNHDVVNLAKGGACAMYVADQIHDYLTTATIQPEIVIAQWPNPMRSMEIDDHGNFRFHNVNHQSTAFHKRLVSDPESFWEEWKSAIFKLNAACKVPLINVCLEDEAFLRDHLPDFASCDIIVHIDEKIPGKTWHFDSAASDQLHHSASCHSKWADRMVSIINEIESNNKEQTELG